jgi:hypothetical protein
MRWQIQKITALPDHVSVDVLLLPDVGDPLQLPAAGLPQNISLPTTGTDRGRADSVQYPLRHDLAGASKAGRRQRHANRARELVGTTGTVTKFT